MAARAQLEPRLIETADVVQGRVEPHYTKVLIRLLGAHALAEKLTAEGYRRVIDTIADPETRRIADKNLAEELKHAAMVYGLLAELGVSEQNADRSLIVLRRAPSFEAARRFAEQAQGELGLLMGNLSLDMTGLIMIGVNYRDSSYAPHARVAELILEEESEHDEFGAGACVLRSSAWAPRPSTRRFANGYRWRSISSVHPEPASPSIACATDSSARTTRNWQGCFCRCWNGA